MKKLLLVVSILFLTVTSYAKEFVLPDFSKSFNEVVSELKENYLIVEKDPIKNQYTINDLHFKYNGYNIFAVVLTEAPENDYMFSIVLEELSTNDWTNCILKTIANNNFYNFKMDGDVVLAVNYNNNYDKVCFFTEITTQVEGTLEYITIAKYSNY